MRQASFDTSGHRCWRTVGRESRPIQRARGADGRLHPTEDGIWDIRSRDKPGLRIFCAFVEKDVMVTFICSPRSVNVSWLHRLPLGIGKSIEWESAIKETKREWTKLFPAHTPVTGDDLNEYLTNASHERIQAGHDGPPISEAKRVYFQERLKNRFFEFLLTRFLEQQKLGLTKAKLARRIGKTPDAVNRWLAAPSNLTLDTISDLLLGISAEELEMNGSSLLNRVSVNYHI